MAIVPVGEWLPDLPKLSNPGSPVAQNVIPISPMSYGPFLEPGTPAAPVIGTAGTDFIVGSFACETYGGNTPLLFVATGNHAGVAQKLWLSTAGGAFANVTPVGGLATAKGDVTDRWRFDTYLGTLIAVNRNNQTQAFTIAQGSVGTIFAPLSAYVAGPPASGAPSADFVASIAAGFTVLGGVSFPPQHSSGSSIFYPNRVWWSGLGNPATWPTPGSQTAIADQSSYTDMPGSLGDVRGLVPNLQSCDLGIFFEHGVRRMTYVGGGPVFEFQTAVNVHGTPAPDSLVSYGNTVFYQAEDGFYGFDGVNPIPIGANKINRWFLQHIGTQFLDQTVGYLDLPNRCVRWAFGQTAPLDTTLIYSLEANRWSVAETPDTGWVGEQLVLADQQTVRLPVNFTTGNQVALFNGPALAASVATAEAQLFPGRRCFVRGVRPLVAGDPTIAVSWRQNQTDPQTTNAAVAQDASGTCPQRVDARFVQATMEVTAGTVWTHIEGFDVDAVPSGLR